MENLLYINKHTANVPVYDWIDMANILGYLYPGEAYVLQGQEAGCLSIKFLNPSGVFTDGMLVNPPSGTYSSCEDYPYETALIGGKLYNVYLLRKTMSIYNPSGQIIGSVSAGDKIACVDDLMGQTMPWLKHATYYKKTNGNWSRIGGTSSSYGFVDTGIRTGSGRTTIAMYGSW